MAEVKVIQSPFADVVLSDKDDKAEWRKQRPVFSGVLCYFPDAMLEVAHCSWVGNEQHNPGEPLHWDREKSDDELDAHTRHLMACAQDTLAKDYDGTYHMAKCIWRLAAQFQRALEQAKEQRGGNI